MRFLKAVLPNLTIALSASLLILAVLNEFNPRMGFLQGKPALLLTGLCCLSSIACALVLYVSWRRGK